MENSLDKRVRSIKSPRGFEKTAWRWMRYSGILVIPLAFIHILIQDVIVGVHNIDINYVEARWSMLGWRIYDGFLLAFAFMHGINGLRQVLLDFILDSRVQKWVNIVLFFFWLLVSLAGLIALIGGVGTGLQ